MDSHKTKYILSLNSDGSFPNSQDKIYFVQPYDQISILLDSKLIQEYHPILLTNYPYQNKEKKLKYPEAPEISQIKYITEVDLKQYTKFKGNFNSEFSWQCDIEIGNFNGSLFLQVVFVEYNNINQDILNIHNFGKPEWIMIQPQVQIHQQQVKLEQLIIQSVHPLQLGNQNRWLEVLRIQTQLGYNAFHFPPLQSLSSSGNIYSIKDHQSLNEEIFGKASKEKAIDNLYKIVQGIKTDLNSLCFTDIILNYTGYDSPWLKDCTECFYNQENTPILQIAIELDVALQNFSDRLARKEQIYGYYKGNRVENDEDVEQLMQIIKKEVFDVLRLEEYFLFDEQALAIQFKSLLDKEKVVLVDKEYQIDDDEDSYFSKSGSQLLQDLILKYCCNFGYKRFGASLKFDKFIKDVKVKHKSYSYESFEIAIKQTQKEMKKRGQIVLSEAISNIKEQIKQNHLYNNNNIVGFFPNTLVPRYFTPIDNNLYAANYGYIQQAPNITNIMDSEELYYLKRSVNIYCDQVKLRYGNNKKSAPILWKVMKQYIKQMANVFDGFYIEHPHTISIEASDYLIRKARNINCNLLIFSQLYSGEANKDSYFCKRIGINAIIKDLSQCNSGFQLYDNLKGFSVYNPIGTLEKMYEPDGPKQLHDRERKTMLNPRLPQYLVYDQNLDGPTLINLYGHRQAFVNLALSSFSIFLQGSPRGYDELYANRINYQNEKRIYQTDGSLEAQTIDCPLHVGVIYKSKWQSNSIAIRGSWSSWAQDNTMFHIQDNYYLGYVDFQQAGQFEYKFVVDGQWLLDDEKPNNGQNHVIKLEQDIEKQKTQYTNFCQIRNKFNIYKKKLDQKYIESQFQFFDNEILTITREHQNKIKSYFIISRAAYKLNVNYKISINITLPGVLNKVKDIFFIDQYCTQDKENNTYLNGLSTKIFRSQNLREYAEIQFDGDQRKTILHFFDIPPGLVIILKCNLDKEQKQSIIKLKQIIQDSFYQPTKEVKDLYQQFTNCDINFLLFSNQDEEISRNKTNLYQIPNKQSLIFAGFAGFFVDMKKASIANDLSLPLFENLREGNWLLNYLIFRLKTRKQIEKYSKYVEEIFELIKKIPKHNIPYFFCLFIRSFKFNIRQRIQMNMIIPGNIFYSSFHKNLIMACYQFISDAPLYISNNQNFVMTSGIPNFSSDSKRIFGRDIFMSFKGCLLIPGLFKEAKQLILLFGSLLRHSLIPNKVSFGVPLRYNCRDVCWWYIKSVFDYIEFTKDPSILQENVQLTFVDDNCELNELYIDQGMKKQMKIHEIIQEIFSGHAKGIKFTEWNAGPLLNSQMNTQGFNISLFLDEKTGFILGGNQYNALTWMDNIGTSEKASNAGQPACYRDGAPIELTALLKHCLVLVSKAYEFGIYPSNSVTTRSGKILTFSQWGNMIERCFEKHYWIPMKKNDYILKENLHNELQTKINEVKQLIRRKCIYKDTVFCQNQNYEFWLRPNGCMAITLAPELFQREHALMYLATVEAYLMDQKSIGIRTLDKKEESYYCGTFKVNDDSSNFSSSLGFNLFNGTEWVFLYGFHLRGLIKMNQDQPTFRNERLMSYLSNYKKYIKYDEYLSLPSFTNENGQLCKDSCPSRAISISQIIEVCYELMLHYLQENKSSPTKVFKKNNI